VARHDAVRPELLPELVCPICRGEFALHVEQRIGEDIERGGLTCAGCARRFPIRAGIPRLVPDDLSSTDRRIAAAFGYEWTHFRIDYEEAAEHFLDWIAPLRPADFAGRRVVDAGCGMGRHARAAARFGAAAVFALDVSEAIEVARRYTAAEPQVHCIQADLRRPPLRGGMDLVYSIGVLNQLPDPAAGFRALAPLLRPGGRLATWVYAAEAGGLFTRVIDPLRARVTSKLPFALLRALTWLPAVLLMVLARGCYRPASRFPRLGARLPGRSYFEQFARFPFALVHCTIFDQLAAPAASYCTREQVAAWFRVAGLSAPEISLRHGNGWRGLAYAHASE
jgi:SAM-dependent methyltransferase